MIRKPAIADFINATAAKRTKNIEAAFQAQVVAIDNIIALEAAANPPGVLPSVEDGLADEFISVCLHIKDEQNTFITERGAAMTAFYAIDNRVNPVLKLIAECKRIFNMATLVFSFPVGHRDESQRSHPYFKVVPYIDVPCGFSQSSHEKLALCANASVTQTLINRFESAAVNADPLPPAQLVEQRIDDVIDTVNQYLATDGATFTAAITYTMRHPDLFVFRSAIQPRSAFVIKTFHPSDDNTDADSDSDSGRAIKPRRRERDTKKERERAEPASRSNESRKEKRACFDWIEFGRCDKGSCRYRHDTDSKGKGKEAKDAEARKCRRFSFPNGGTSEYSRAADGDRPSRRS